MVPAGDLFPRAANRIHKTSDHIYYIISGFSYGEKERKGNVFWQVFHPLLAAPLIDRTARRTNGRAGPEFASMTMMTMMIFVLKLRGTPERLDGDCAFGCFQASSAR